MSKPIIELNPAGDPLLRLPSALANRRLTLNLSDDHSHPLRAFASKTSSFKISLTKMLDVLRDADKWNFNDSGELIKLPGAFRELCYAASELFEVYTDVVPISIHCIRSRESSVTYRNYRNISSKHRKDWSLLCNRIKHNHNTITPVRYNFTPSGRYVCGFALLRPESHDALNFNPDFHKGNERCRAFNVSLRQLVADIVLTDNAAVSLLDTISDQEAAAPLPEVQFALCNGSDLKRIAARPLWNVPNAPSMFDGFIPNAVGYQIIRQQAETISEPARVISTFDGDGLTRTFPYREAAAKRATLSGRPFLLL